MVCQTSILSTCGNFIILKAFTLFIISPVTSTERIRPLLEIVLSLKLHGVILRLYTCVYLEEAHDWLMVTQSDCGHGSIVDQAQMLHVADKQNAVTIGRHSLLGRGVVVLGVAVKLIGVSKCNFTLVKGVQQF